MGSENVKKLKGMSLIECLAAMVVLTVVSMILYVGFTVSSSYTRRGMEIGKASEEGMRTLELAQIQGSLNDGTGHISTPDTVVKDGSMKIKDESGSVIYNVQGRYVVVTVDYDSADTDSSEGVKSVKYTTFIEDRS